MFELIICKQDKQKFIANANSSIYTAQETNPEREQNELKP